MSCIHGVALRTKGSHRRSRERNEFDVRKPKSQYKNGSNSQYIVNSIFEIGTTTCFRAGAGANTEASTTLMHDRRIPGALARPQLPGQNEMLSPSAQSHQRRTTLGSNCRRRQQRHGAQQQRSAPARHHRRRHLRPLPACRSARAFDR